MTRTNAIGAMIIVGICCVLSGWIGFWSAWLMFRNGLLP